MKAVKCVECSAPTQKSLRSCAGAIVAALEPPEARKKHRVSAVNTSPESFCTDGAGITPKQSFNHAKGQRWKLISEILTDVLQLVTGAMCDEANGMATLARPALVNFA